MKSKLLKSFLKDSTLEMRSVEEQFSDGANLQEGVSGQREIDTTFENTVRPAKASTRTQTPEPDISLK